MVVVNSEKRESGNGEKALTRIARIGTNLFNRGADDRHQTRIKSEGRNPKHAGHELTRMLSATNGYRFLNNQATKVKAGKRETRGEAI